MKKLLYILPEYRSDAHTHFSYIPDFLARLAPSLSITLLVERGELPAINGVRSDYSSLLSVISARLSGCRTAYVHYSFKGAFLSALIFRLTGGKVFYWNCGESWKYGRSFFRGAFERLVYMLVSHVVTGSAGLAQQYATHYGIPRSKVLVMPNWIDVRGTRGKANREEKRRALGVGADTKIVVFAHRLSERKGAQYLPDIAAHLPEDAVLLVIGDGPLRKSVEEKTLSARPAARFLGWQAHDVVLSYMSAADAFIMPSDEEGFPHVLLEAFVFGVPFVATDVGAVKEIVPEEALPFIVPSGDTARFSKALKAALAFSEPEKERFAEVTAAWVERFDTTAVIARFLALVSKQ